MNDDAQTLVVGPGQGMTVPGPAGGPLTFKARSEQTAGRLIALGDERADVEAGAFVFVPLGTPHAFRNAGEAPARILVWFTPAGMEPFFDRFAALAASEACPQAFRDLGAPVGMEVVAPPIGTA